MSAQYSYDDEGNLSEVARYCKTSDAVNAFSYTYAIHRSDLLAACLFSLTQMPNSLACVTAGFRESQALGPAHRLTPVPSLRGLVCGIHRQNRGGRRSLPPR
jgi:hypothetical protein